MEQRDRLPQKGNRDNSKESKGNFRSKKMQYLKFKNSLDGFSSRVKMTEETHELKNKLII